MTRSEIIAIQSELGVQADGIWGPITAAAYAARMAHEAPGAPVALPPVSKPWWTSRAVLGLLASVLALLAGHSLLVLPYVVRVIGASLASFDFSIEEAAISLGSRPLIGGHTAVGECRLMPRAPACAQNDKRGKQAPAGKKARWS
jgi:ABC-type spermidine/putrescine transport system permease subunit II